MGDHANDILVENVVSPDEDSGPPDNAASAAETVAPTTEQAPPPTESGATDAIAPSTKDSPPPDTTEAGLPPPESEVIPMTVPVPDAADGIEPASNATTPAPNNAKPALDATTPAPNTAEPALDAAVQPAGEQPPPADGAAPVQKTPEEEKTDREYNMYLAMAKSLTLQLPFERDRVVASKWVKKFERSEIDIKDRLNYLKLLSVSMFSHKLAGPFRHVPKDEPDFDDIGSLSINDIITELSEHQEYYSPPPYYVEMSGDLKEYVAYQEIPNFGAHFYYAFSNETVLHWHNEKRAIVPAGGVNYPILDPPTKQISKTAEAFKAAYMQYSRPESRKLTKVPSDIIPSLMPELRKRKVVTNDDISRMGTKKFVRDSCKCPTPAPNVNQNRVAGAPVRCKSNGSTPTTKGRKPPSSTGRQARC